NQIEDWCISRQIWWGHRIPAYYCKSCSRNGLIFNDNGDVVKVMMEKGAKPIVCDVKPAICPVCGSCDMVQDPDVLDTWFSSALWPFSVFGWPKKTEELNYFYPTSLLVTGYEILYLWVARMIMSGLFHIGKIPFSKVYIHGIVRDKHGQKMSKSKGNVVDPLEMMKKYGTDAMRFTIAINSLGGKDILFCENAIIGGRNFINKLYNVSRFVLMNIKDGERFEFSKDLDVCDRWILTRLSEVSKNYSSLMNKYLVSEALDSIYGFVWDEFCDWYIEISKMYLKSDKRNTKMAVILEVLKCSIKMLHPFIPFVTEEIYSNLKFYFGESSEFLIETRIKDFNFSDYSAVSHMQIVMDVVREIRTLRSEFAIHPAKEIEVFILSGDDERKFLVSFESYIKHLAKVKSIEYSLNRSGRFIKGYARGYKIYIKVDG
ncbi:MAG: class I tRNA ligase family protein, partial [Elusimicrobiales bacterium]